MSEEKSIDELIDSINAVYEDEAKCKAIFKRILTQSGIVNIDFEDLKSVVDGCTDCRVASASVDANINNRAQEAFLKIEWPSDMKPKSVILIISCPTDKPLTLEEAARLCESIQMRVSKGANLIWGQNTSTNDTFDIDLVLCR